MGAVWLGSFACHHSPPTIDPVKAAAYARDSAQFVLDSTRWARAPFVVDSISRLINTDSLYRLKRAFLTVENPVPIWGAILCEMTRLSGRYGLLPAEAAEARMLDTVYKAGDRAANERATNRLRYMTPDEAMSVTIGVRTCGPDVFRYLLTEVDGIPLSYPLPAPVRPKRP